VLSQLSYDPFFLLRYFPLLFVAAVRSLSHILAYAPSLSLICASIKEKSLAKLCFDVFPCSSLQLFLVASNQATGLFQIRAQLYTLGKKKSTAKLLGF
jgi:hypothetical protein